MERGSTDFASHARELDCGVRRSSAFFITVASVAFLCPTPADAQTREVAFSTDEGIWL